MKKKNCIKINALLNATKQLLSLMFPLITVPYVTRILGASNYGKINFGNSILSYFILFAAFGINTYAVREGAGIRENKESFSKFVNEVFSINVITTIFSYLALFLLLSCWDKLQEYRVLILVQSLSIIFTTLGAEWINIIFEDYKYITIRYILVQLISIILLFLFIKKQNDYIIYALITIVATVGGNIFNIIYIRKYIKLKFIWNINWRAHIVPLLILLGNSFAVVTYINIDVSMLGIFKTDADVGVYSVATKIYTVVKQLINAIIVVMLPRLSALIGQQKKEEYLNVLNEVKNVLCYLILPAMVGLFVLSDKIILLISGTEYLSGSIALKILSVSLGFAVLGCFFSNCILLPQKMEFEFFKATVVSCIVNLVLNFFAIPILNYNGAALTTLFSEMIVVFMCIIACKYQISISIERKMLRNIICGTFGIAVVCISVITLIDNLMLCIISATLISIIVYLLVLGILKDKFVIEVFDSIVSKLKNK